MWLFRIPCGYVRYAVVRGTLLWLIRLKRSSRRRIEERAAVRRRSRRHGRPLEVARPRRACPVPPQPEPVSRARGLLGGNSPRVHRACLGLAGANWMVCPAEGSEDRSGTCGGYVAFHMPSSPSPQATCLRSFPSHRPPRLSSKRPLKSDVPHLGFGIWDLEFPLRLDAMGDPTCAVQTEEADDGHAAGSPQRRRYHPRRT